MSDFIVLTNDDNTIIVINYPITTIFHSPPLLLLPTSHLFPPRLPQPRSRSEASSPYPIYELNHRAQDHPLLHNFQIRDPEPVRIGPRSSYLIMCAQNYVYERVERGDKRGLQKHVRVRNCRAREMETQAPPGPALSVGTGVYCKAQWRNTNGEGGVMFQEEGV